MTPEEAADLDNAREEVQRLRRWKAEAMTVMEGLQELGRALDLAPGTRISGTSALLAVGRLKDELRAILKERNTWARRLADANDERDAAREQAQTARETLSIVSNDRDGLHIAIEELIARWEQQPDREGNHLNLSAATTERRARELRRVIARWETT